MLENLAFNLVESRRNDQTLFIVLSLEIFPEGDIFCGFIESRHIVDAL